MVFCVPSLGRQARNRRRASLPLLATAAHAVCESVRRIIQLPFAERLLTVTPGAFLLTGTDGNPGSELARRFERLGAGSGFCNQVLSGSHTDTWNFT
jgi:hypothetical protein